MKHKLVLWGKNAESEKVLIALELQAEHSNVKVYSFPHETVNDAFVDSMMSHWRDGSKEVEFPEGYTVIDRPLSVTESLLPENLSADRPETLHRTQTEWHFIVLSQKLHQAYQEELAEFKEKIEALKAYDGNMFHKLRKYWDKLLEQKRSRNIHKEHADELLDNAAKLFDKLKEMRKRMDEEVSEISQSAFDQLSKALEKIEESIESGSTRFNNTFDQLKKIQQEYQKSRMTNEHRSSLWERIDGAYKKLKARRFGPEANDGTLVERFDSRLKSLDEAVKRIESSLRRDEDELQFQQRKVNKSEGQLEAQIRLAKIKMIEERVTEKRIKLEEFTKIQSDIQRQIKSIQDREAKQAAKEAERQAIEAKKAELKSAIEAETHAKAEAAAETAIPKNDSLFEAATNVLGDALLDALDTAKAVANVAAEKAGEVMDEMVERAEEVLDAIKKVQTENTSVETSANEKQPTPEEAAKGQESIIIDDVVHKQTTESEALESLKAADASATEETANETQAAKPKRAAKKKTDGA